jgi:hypothetical protein
MIVSHVSYCFAIIGSLLLSLTFSCTVTFTFSKTQGPMPPQMYNDFWHQPTAAPLSTPNYGALYMGKHPEKTDEYPDHLNDPADSSPQQPPVSTPVASFIEVESATVTAAAEPDETHKESDLLSNAESRQTQNSKPAATESDKTVNNVDYDVPSIYAELWSKHVLEPMQGYGSSQDRAARLWHDYAAYWSWRRLHYHTDMHSRSNPAEQLFGRPLFPRGYRE